MSDNKKAALELGTKPVGKLLMQYAIPAIIAMTASSLYNMVDSIFIGQGVGPLAISGLAITFPLMNLSAAFGAAVGVGASTFISVKLGQKDYDTAKHIFGNTMTLNLITGLGVGLVCLLFLDPILRFFGASDQTLCTRLYGDNIAWQRHNPHVFWPERRVTSGRQAKACYERHYLYRGSQHSA